MSLADIRHQYIRHHSHIRHAVMPKALSILSKLTSCVMEVPLGMKLVVNLAFIDYSNRFLAGGIDKIFETMTDTASKLVVWSTLCITMAFRPTLSTILCNALIANEWTHNPATYAKMWCYATP